MDRTNQAAADVAEDVAALAKDSGRRVGVAESLTGGQVAAALAAAPDASEWFVGGVVAYSPQVKRDMLGVGTESVFSRACVLEMSRGARRLLGADVVVAVSGVGGPEPEEGHPPGSVWFAVTTGDGSTDLTDEQVLPGEPPDVVAAAVRHALQLVLNVLAGARARQ
jgi:nicotinamide-nucleotide amidase